MNTLLDVDQQLFLLLNQIPHTTLFDTIALILSGVGTAGIIWFLLGAILIYKEEKKDHLFFAPLFAAGGISWFLVEFILKPLITRPRPIPIVGDFSFPSGHATIAFAMAAVLSQKEPKWRWLFYGLAVAISISRIYLGKHFPLDVVAGGILGWGIGTITLVLVRRVRVH